MDLMPTDLQLTGNDLVITWNDGTIQTLTARSLREHCPCATCREKRTAEREQPENPLAIIGADEAVSTRIVGMRPVGSYGYSIAFSDGHSTGIFSLDLLRRWDSS